MCVCVCVSVRTCVCVCVCVCVPITNGSVIEVSIHVCLCVCCRTHLSIEGGSRLLARAIKGLAAAPPVKQSRHHSGERGRRGGREERGRREVAGSHGKKRTSWETHSELENTIAHCNQSIDYNYFRAP